MNGKGGEFCSFKNYLVSKPVLSQQSALTLLAIPSSQGLGTERTGYT